MKNVSNKPDDDIAFLKRIGRSGEALAAKTSANLGPADVYKRALARAHAAQLKTPDERGAKAC